MPRWPIGAREDRTTVPAGTRVVEHDSYPRREIVRAEPIIVRESMAPRSAGVIQATLPPQYPGFREDGVEPLTMRHTSPSRANR